MRVWAKIVIKLADLQYRVLDAVRHPDAFTAARTATELTDFTALRGQHVCLLVSYKRSGQPIPSPMLCAMAGGNVYVRCEERAAKASRIRRNPNVLVGPCTYRGKPLAPLARGIARELTGADARRAHDILFGNYRWYDRAYETIADRLPVQLAYLEITAPD
jgi:uncharacterized protein